MKRGTGDNKATLVLNLLYYRGRKITTYFSQDMMEEPSWYSLQVDNKLSGRNTGRPGNERRGQGCHNDAGHTDQYRTPSVALIALQARLSGSLAPRLALLNLAHLFVSAWVTDWLVQSLTAWINFSLIRCLSIWLIKWLSGLLT